MGVDPDSVALKCCEEIDLEHPLPDTLAGKLHACMKAIDSKHSLTHQLLQEEALQHICQQLGVEHNEADLHSVAEECCKEINLEPPLPDNLAEKLLACME